MTAELDSLLHEIELAFRMERPSWFVNAAHCCECAEHEESLQAETPDSLGLDVVGSPAWDPICFISNPDGFKYFLPALARLACGSGDDYYLTQFLFHLNSERVSSLSAKQRKLLEAFLYRLSDENGDEIEEMGDFPEMEWALRRLTGEDGPAHYAGHEGN